MIASAKRRSRPASSTATRSNHGSSRTTAMTTSAISATCGHAAGPSRERLAPGSRRMLRGTEPAGRIALLNEQKRIPVDAPDGCQSGVEHISKPSMKNARRSGACRGPNSGTACGAKREVLRGPRPRSTNVAGSGTTCVGSTEGSQFVHAKCGYPKFDPDSLQTGVPNRQTSRALGDAVDNSTTSDAHGHYLDHLYLDNLFGIDTVYPERG